MRDPGAGPGADGATPRLGDYLRVLPQYPLPQRALSALMFRLTRVRVRPWKSLQIRWFIRHFRVEGAFGQDELLHAPGGDRIQGRL